MREILFRGKRVTDKKWIEGSLIVLDDDSGYYFITEPYKSASTFPLMNLIFDRTYLVDPETVCQYTGLTDKNGKKIFEGDVVKAKQGKYEDVATVGFENGSFMVYPIFSKIYERNTWEYWYNDWDLEVIGNIFDNPELMKGGEADE